MFLYNFSNINQVAILLVGKCSTLSILKGKSKIIECNFSKAKYFTIIFIEARYLRKWLRTNSELFDSTNISIIHF